jgi:uncharacterized protein
MSLHPITHIEFSSTDRKKSASFYHAVFGWQTQHIEEMNYTTFSTGENELGGGLNPAPENMPIGTTTVYIDTGDIEASLAKIEANGGKTLRPKDEIPGFGWFAIFQDPSGNMVGLFKSGNPGA